MTAARGRWSAVWKGAPGLALCALLLALCPSTRAQQPANTPRIGFLGGTSLSTIAGRIEAFRGGLRGLGYGEGQNSVIECRWAEGKAARLPGLAAALVRLNVDVIVTGGPADTRAARNATAAIPVVMGFDNDPVGSGFVRSLARPGGNITGLSTLSPELSGKRLELLKEIVPRLSRVAVLGPSIQPGNAQSLREPEQAATELQVQVQYLDAADPKDIEVAFRAAASARADAIIVLQSPVFNPRRAQLAELAVKSRLPAVYAQPEYVESGGLATYGPSMADLFRRAATYVDRILRGARPADLPVEQPTKFELVVNLKAAREIGLTIP